MDGNGRWARRHNRPVSFGHRAGVRAIKRALEGCEELGVHALSVYAFSTENWARPRAEVRALMRLLRETMQREIEEMHRRGVRIVVSGRRDELSQRMRERIDEAVARTAGNRSGVLNVCLNYGGRAEIVDAVRRAIADGLRADDVDEQAISERLYNPELPDPDLIIRTAGEHRVSNFPLGFFFVLSGTALKQVDVAIVLSGALVVGLGAFLVVPGRRQGLGRWAMGMAGALYIGMPFNYYLQLYSSKPHGLVWTAFTIFAVIAADAAALLVGSRFGSHPFFSAISPRKTLEGAIAGIVAATIVMLIGVSLVIGLPPLHGIALGLLVGFGAEMGDLVESQMKRIAEVKDSSNLIPGHGGVLDRLDSILFPPILVYFYVSMFGLLTR